MDTTDRKDIIVHAGRATPVVFYNVTRLEILGKGLWIWSSTDLPFVMILGHSPYAIYRNLLHNNLHIFESRDEHTIDPERYIKAADLPDYIKVLPVQTSPELIGNNI